MLKVLVRLWGMLFFSLLISVSSAAYAEETEAETSQPDLPFDVRIVVDISGSMKQTDPENLRVPALNLLVELLPEGARAGVWTFGRYVNNLVPVAPVDDDWRTKTRASASSISSVGLQTNLSGVLDDVAWGVNKDSGYQQSVILLTDGKIDMAPESSPDRDAVNEKDRVRLMTDVLNKYREAGVAIHTLALSDFADKDLLQQIALESGGLYSEAKSADDLMKAFLRAFDRAVPAEQVPMEDNTFSIDGSVKEFTALIFRSGEGGKKTQLLTPSGDSYSAEKHPENVRWYSDLTFDLVTVQEPEAGTWVAEADLDPSNRVTILSDLALDLAGLPATIFPGDKLDVEIRLTNEGDTVSKPELLRLTDIVMKVKTASGREGSKVLSDPEAPPADGIYREALHRLKDLGEYEVSVVAEGRTFQRKKTLSMTMIQPVEVVHGPDVEAGTYNISVKALSDNLDLERSRVIAKIKSPDENSVIQSMEFEPENMVWMLKVDGSKGMGSYQVDLNVRGLTQSGKNFKIKPDPILFDMPIAGSEPVEETVAEESSQQAENNSGSEQKMSAEEKPADDSEMQKEEAPPENTIAPDLAAKAAETPEPEAEKKPEAEPVPEKKPEPVAVAPEAEEVSEPEEEGIAWWIYVLLGLSNVVVIGGAVWWFLLRKKTVPTVTDSQMDRDASAGSDFSDLEEELAGDFDSLDEGDEEDIPLSAGDSDSSSDFDEDFSIDPDEGGEEPATDDSDDESWGEFDTPAASSGDDEE